MKKFSFDMLPDYISQIEARLERIENSISGNQLSKNVKEYIDAKEAAEFLNFTLSTLYSKVCKGEVPVFKKGNRLYFSRVELMAWIENGKKATLEDIEQEAYNIAVNLRNKSRN